MKMQNRTLNIYDYDSYNEEEKAQLRKWNQEIIEVLYQEHDYEKGY